MVFEVGIGVIKKAVRRIKLEAQSMEESFDLTIGNLRFFVRKALTAIENQ